jgi:hypothetical protein
MKRLVRCLLVGLVPALLIACNGAPDYPQVGNGALANGSFTYLCVSASDSFCAGTQNVAPLPTAIALGTSFRIAFAPAPGGAAATLDIAGTDMLDLAPDGTLQAKLEGVASVFALDPGGEVEDYINLVVQIPTSLGLSGVDAATTLHPGDTRAVRAQPLDQLGAALAGTGSYDWETSDASVLAIDRTETDRSRGSATLSAVGPGTARVRVVLGSATTTIDILVGGA